MLPRSIPLLCWSLLLSAPRLAAQAGYGHAAHERAGAPRDSIGRVAFPTSCAAGAQRIFERGVALLHSFWYEEA